MLGKLATERNCDSKRIGCGFKHKIRAVLLAHGGI